MDSPALILLPGLDGRGPFFDTLISALPEGLRTQTFSYPDTPMGYTELAAYVSERIDTDAPFVLLGESFGGPLATRLAASGLPGLRGLILAATFSIPPLPAWVIRKLAAGYPWLIRSPYAASIINYFLYNGRHIIGAQELTDIFRAQPDATVLKRIDEVANTHTTDALLSLPCPVLALAAKQDRIVLRNYPKGTFDAAKQREMLIFPASHALLHDQITACAKRISDFIQSVK